LPPLSAIVLSAFGIAFPPPGAQYITLRKNKVNYREYAGRCSES